MSYTTLFDVSTRPPLDWRSLVLPFGLALLAVLCFAFSRSSSAGRYFLLVFAALAVIVPVALPYWDHSRLTKALTTGQCAVAEGTLTGHWERKWTERRNGKNNRLHYEGFRVGAVSFGYYRSRDASDFNNPDNFLFRDGLPVRIHYFPERQLDDGTVLNRIVKVEVQPRAEPVASHEKARP